MKYKGCCSSCQIVFDSAHRHRQQQGRKAAPSSANPPSSPSKRQKHAAQVRSLFAPKICLELWGRAKLLLAQM